jgi:hypothetical protein
MPLARNVYPAAALAQQALFAQVAGADDEEVAEKTGPFPDHFLKTGHCRRRNDVFHVTRRALNSVSASQIF